MVGYLDTNAADCLICFAVKAGIPQGLIGIVFWFVRSPRISFVPSPVRPQIPVRRQAVVGRERACVGGVLLTLKMAVPSSTSSNMAT